MTTKAKRKMRNTVKVFANIDEISKFAADKFFALSKKAIKKDGRFTVALAGGTTPKALYELLTTDQYKSKIDWENVYFFLSDERDVSPMSERSNYKMINESLITKLPIPTTNVFRWHTEIINAPEVAESYERSLFNFFKLSKGKFPNFDLILLGMGDDGHTASLFPFTDALFVDDKLAISNYIEKLDRKRLTFTYPTINNASNIIFLVSGENKSKTLKTVLEDTINIEKFPAQNISLNKGKVLWLVDKDAAKDLSS